MVRRRRSDQSQLPIPPLVASEPALKPVLDLLKDTYITPRMLAARWVLSEDHLSNMRRRTFGLPWLRLPTGSKPNRGSIRYRLSDMIDAEIRGTDGGIRLSDIETAIMSFTEISPEDRLKLIVHMRSIFGGRTSA